MDDNTRVKFCENCKESFNCYSKDCWCAELPLIMPLESDKGCYCPACLKNIIDKKFEEKALSSKDYPL